MSGAVVVAVGTLRILAIPKTKHALVGRSPLHYCTTTDINASVARFRRMSQKFPRGRQSVRGSGEMRDPTAWLRLVTERLEEAQRQRIWDVVEAHQTGL